MKRKKSSDPNQPKVLERTVDSEDVKDMAGGGIWWGRSGKVYLQLK